MKKEILKQLKSEYERHEIKPSADLWDRIEQEAGEMPDISPKTSFQWWKYAAVLLLLVSTSAILYFTFNTDNVEKTITKTGLPQKPEKTEKDPDILPQKKTNENTGTTSDLAVHTETRSSHINNKKESRIQVYNDQYERSHHKTETQRNHKTDNIIQIASDDQVKTPDMVKQEEKIIEDNDKLAVSPNIPEKKPAKYIKASDLLAGREYEKSPESRKKGSYVRIDLNKLKPHFSQVVTLGITVHSNNDQ
ncbi:hypothetical protein HNP38_000873 [Chryseobacterium defluvii]|uniref:Uncharacterized protein n=1 Tax=Chryseobacterium defluvii TaxID=160396 RepID=A0A840K7X0_9FLAO|nr:hypothetical protein [Chryseobacterium defluvii]MBB4805601.1 hypothetical protein [Chryseobacterium defluvii]